jgi:chemotaxis protein methyltransferase CheR
MNPCFRFLSWALPQLKLRIEGFRKVQRQVCRRVNQRMHQLALGSYNQYQQYLEENPSEWAVFDSMTPITISRFYRDAERWEVVRQQLPALVKKAIAQNRPLRFWSAGCASGEEPYTMAIIWKQLLEPEYPEARLQIIATDLQEVMLRRARIAAFGKSSLKELPEQWVTAAFERSGKHYCLKESYKQMVDFLQQDIRHEMPGGIFDIVFCKNIVAMYHEPSLAGQIFQKIISRMDTDGVLVLGKHELFPLNRDEFRAITIVD